MVPEIVITIKIVTTAEGNAVSTIQTAGNEEYDIEIPSVDTLPGSIEGDLPEPPAYPISDEAIIGSEPPPPDVEAAAGLSEDEIPEPPTYANVDETMQEDIPPPAVDTTVSMDEADVPEVPTHDDLYEVDESAIPVPEIDEAASVEVMDNPTDAEVPPVPSI